MKITLTILIVFIVTNVLFAIDINEWKTNVYYSESRETNLDLSKSKSFKLDNIPEYLQTYLKDENIYNTLVVVFPNNKIIIEKLTKSPNYKNYDGIYCKTEKDSIVHGDFMYDISNNIEKACKNLQVIQTSVVNKTFICTVFDISKYGEKTGESFLTTITINGRTIWESTYRFLADIKQIDNNTYMISNMNYTNYVHIINNERIIEEYSLPFMYNNSGHTGKKDPFPISCDILTDNIIRFKYTDGAIEHWKIKFNKEDFEKNKKMNKALLWWNGIGNGSPINHEKAKSWDYNENIYYEPVYENML